MHFLSCKINFNMPHVHVAEDDAKGGALPIAEGRGLEAAMSLFPSFVPQGCMSKLGIWLRKDF